MKKKPVLSISHKWENKKVSRFEVQVTKRHNKILRDKKRKR